MELARKIADRGLLLTSLDKGIGMWNSKKNERYIIFTKSITKEEAKNARMLENLKTEKKEAALEIIKGAEIIWKDLSRHLPYLQLLETKTIESYVKATQQAAEDGTMETWLSLDPYRLAQAFKKGHTDTK